MVDEAEWDYAVVGIEFWITVSGLENEGRERGGISGFEDTVRVPRVGEVVGIKTI